MSKKETSYADAMNEWAAKRSILRNRRNRILHPNPESPDFLRALGYAARLAIVAFILWIIGSKLSSNYYNGEAFNEKLKSEIRSLIDAEAFEASNFSWQNKKAQSKRITATGSDSAFYRKLEAMNLSFELPLLKRIRSSWKIDLLQIQKLSLDLRPDSNSAGDLGDFGATRPALPELVNAGLLPSPDFSKLTITRVSCGEASIKWGQSRTTHGAIEGTKFKLFSASPDWQLDLEGGILQQNWLHGLAIESLRVRRKGDRLVISDSQVRLGEGSDEGTLEGHVTLESPPKLELLLELPEAHTRDLLPDTPNLPEYFYGELKLSMKISGSTNTVSGVVTSGTATLLSGTFNKIPILESIDNLLNSSSFRIFSPDNGEFEFNTAGGTLNVSNFECKSGATSSILRGNFSYSSAKRKISGMLQLGVRPSVISDNELAQSFFTEHSEGYVWLDIPLSGSLKNSSEALQKKISLALRDEAE